MYDMMSAGKKSTLISYLYFYEVTDMKNSSTTTIARGYTTALLNTLNYEVTDFDGYIRATHPAEDTPDLLIYVMGRKLSKGESTPTCVTEAAVDKLLIKAQRQAGDLIPCIAFCVCRYSYTDAEVCIVPVAEIENRAEQGGVYNKISQKYYYNFGNAPQNTTPSGAIARMEFCAHLLGK